MKRKVSVMGIASCALLLYMILWSHVPWLKAQAGQHGAALTWTLDAPVSGETITYNVYRSATSGAGYAKINTATVNVGNYLDTTGTAGSTYYYVITAFATGDGIKYTGTSESGYSNQVSVTFLVQTPVPAVPVGLQGVAQ